jgi:hypothetical protein
MKQIVILILALGFFINWQEPLINRHLPTGIVYLSRAEWGAKPPVLPMRSHQLTRLTIHHTGTPQQPGRSLVEKMKALQKFSQEDSPLADGSRKQAWADVPYHLYIDINGEIAEGRDINYAGDTNTAYDPAGHLLVVVEGNFEKEAITAAQLKTLEMLVPALANHYTIQAENLAGHKDFAQTSCPGNALYMHIASLQKLMKRK